jgi:hypothetical protein
LFLDTLQAFGGVAEDAKAAAGVGGVVLAVCEPKIERPDLFFDGLLARATSKT